MTTPTKKPTHFVYTVREGKEADQRYWTKVGAAFAHRDRKGFSILLDALPLNGRLTVRAPHAQKPDDFAILVPKYQEAEG